MALPSASRRPEKLLDAPASVSVINSEDIESQTVLASSEYASGMPAVEKFIRDRLSTGIGIRQILGVRGNQA